MINNIQTMEIQLGNNGLTSGTHSGVKLVSCITDGDIIVTFRSGATETVSLVAGTDRSLSNLQVEISSGSFDINN